MRKFFEKIKSFFNRCINKIRKNPDDKYVFIGKTNDQDPKEVKVETPNFLKFYDDDKEFIAENLRPIVKSLNFENKNIYNNLVNEDLNNLKYLKVYLRLVKDDTLCICNFTQSDSYNVKLETLVKDFIVPQFQKEISQFDASWLNIEAKDGHIVFSINSESDNI